MHEFVIYGWNMVETYELQTLKGTNNFFFQIHVCRKHASSLYIFYSLNFFYKKATKIHSPCCNKAIYIKCNKKNVAKICQFRSNASSDHIFHYLNLQQTLILEYS